jgi:hypothetical protein
MSSKTTDSPLLRPRANASRPQVPSIPDTVAYWIENPEGSRVTPLYRRARTPMILLGSTLEKREHLDSWSLVRRDAAGLRHIVASGAELAELARPFLPARTPGEAAALAPLLAALRRITDPDPDLEITDERVY